MDHPYVQYENTPVWEWLNKALKELIENGDLKLQTREEYVTGYLCHKLSSSARPASTTKKPDTGK